MTISEKIIAAHSGRDSVTPGEVLYVEPDILMIHDFFIYPRYINALEELGVERIWEPDKVAIVFDHAAPEFNSEWAEKHARSREWVTSQGITKFWDVGQGGVSHQMASEVGLVWPGMVFVNSDPHVTLNGAFGAFAVSFNTLEVLVTGKGWCRVPETIRVDLHGALPPAVTGRDLFLATVRTLGAENMIYHVVEFAGPGLSTLPLDERMTVCDLLVLAGVKTAIIEPDQIALDYLAKHTDRPLTPVRSDPDARYLKTVELNLSELEPMVVAPPNPFNAHPLGDLVGTEITVGFIGSCAGARMDQLRVAASILKGRRVHPGVRLLIQPPSLELQLNMASEGLTEIFLRAGAVLNPPGCGMCWGGGSTLADSDVCLASNTMNNPGRMGSARARIFHANEAIIAASAVEGRITDPRTYLLARRTEQPPNQT
ncbi:MAG: 3-isopropylmalate dehydratase large subunit [Planctomycetes bacterium]|nr:3-isopropylmalate dehydratase large subunit [Planctomycetota bacterium]